MLHRFKRRLEIHLIPSRSVEIGSPAAAGPAAAAAAAAAAASASSQPPLLMGVVVEGEGGGLQLFCRGAPALVVPRCTSFWDGEGLSAGCKPGLHPA